METQNEMEKQEMEKQNETWTINFASRSHDYVKSMTAGNQAEAQKIMKDAKNWPLEFSDNYEDMVVILSSQKYGELVFEYTKNFNHNF